MKKIIIPLFFFVVLALGFLFPAPNKTTKANTSYTLISPTSIVATSSHVYVADDATGKLLKYSLTTSPSVNGLVPESSLNLAGIKKMILKDDSIIAFTKTDGTASLYLIDLNLTLATQITFNSSYSLMLVTDIAVNGTYLYALRDGGDIDQFTFLSSTNLSSPVTYDKQNYLNDQSIEFTMLDVVDGSFSLKSNSFSYKLETSPSLSALPETSLTDNESYLFSSGDYAVTSAGRVIKNSSFSTLTSLFQEISGFYADSNHIYFASKATHQILKFNISTEELTDLRVNAEINLNNLGANNFKNIKLTQEADLYFKPYSITPTKTLPAHTTLNVVAIYNNFYYCLVVENGKNEFLFLNTSSSSFEVLDTGTNNTMFTATRKCNIYTYPTTIVDNKNNIISTINASEETIILTSSTITNSLGELFYLTKTGENYGFIRSNFLQSTKGTVELTSPCNAKTKRSTTLFECSDGTGTILTLEKGTRITLLEETSPTKTYILAEYQDPDGIVYTGYLLAEDISTDGLSTLQILGIILILSNIAILTVILIIKKRSKKWKVNITPDAPPV